MAELTVDILELVLKQLSDACMKNKSCEGCKFLKHTKGANLDFVYCRINGEPHNWELTDGEGSDADADSGVGSCGCGSD